MVWNLNWNKGLGKDMKNYRIMKGDNVRKLIKEVISSGLFSTEGNVLPYQIFQRFVQLLADQSAMRDVIYWVTFRGTTAQLDTIDLPDGYVMAPAVETTDNQIYNVPELARISFSPKWFKIKFKITDESININLEGEPFIDVMLSLMAKAQARDWDRIILYGNKEGVANNVDQRITGYAAGKYCEDWILNKCDGIVQTILAKGNVLDVSAYTYKYFHMEIGRQLMLVIPESRRDRVPQMEFFCDAFSASDYEDDLYQKGDDYPTIINLGTGGGGKLSCRRLPINEIPYMVEHPTTVQNETFASSGATLQLDYYPVVDDSDIILESDVGQTYTTPYTRDSDYSITNTDGVITDIGGALVGSEKKITYKMPGIVLLFRRKQFVWGMNYNRFNLEYFRDVENSTDLYVNHASGDGDVIDGTETAIAWGIEGKTPGAS